MPEGFDKPAGRLSASRAVRSPLPASWIKGLQRQQAAYSPGRPYNRAVKNTCHEN
jgi:hypothetical protein